MKHSTSTHSWHYSKFNGPSSGAYGPVNLLFPHPPGQPRGQMKGLCDKKGRTLQNEVKKGEALKNEKIIVIN